MKYLKVRYVLLGLGLAVALYFFTTSVKLEKVKSAVPIPQAIFVLGGGQDREVFAAELARQHPELDVWVSSGSPPEIKNEIFKEVGVPFSRLHLDYQATDTVTNFTTMVGEFQQLEIKHVHLVTSDFHMRRGKAIAFFVFGSQGITCTPMEVASVRKEESMLRISKDIVRSLFWLSANLV